MKGLLAPQNTFLDTIATRFDGTRKWGLPDLHLSLGWFFSWTFAPASLIPSEQ